jgi:hypothetical protein
MFYNRLKKKLKKFFIFKKNYNSTFKLPHFKNKPINLIVNSIIFFFKNKKNKLISGKVTKANNNLMRVVGSSISNITVDVKHFNLKNKISLSY